MMYLSPSRKDVDGRVFAAALRPVMTPAGICAYPTTVMAGQTGPPPAAEEQPSRYDRSFLDAPSESHLLIRVYGGRA